MHSIIVPAVGCGKHRFNARSPAVAVVLQDKEMVDRLLQLKTQLDEVLTVSFASSAAFSDQLTTAFQTAVNSRSNKPAELVAKFIDAKLRGSKGVNEGELEASLDKALVLFGYIQVNISCMLPSSLQAGARQL